MFAVAIANIVGSDAALSLLGYELSYPLTYILNLHRQFHYLNSTGYSYFVGGFAVIRYALPNFKVSCVWDKLKYSP